MDQGNPSRIIAIDLVRGIAIALMIFSHGVKGLLSFEQFPDWGLVPLHLITKFSSTLFFLIFGLTLAVSFAPATQDPGRWPKKRRRLLIRGLTIFFWYKVLTVIELSHLHNPQEILDALLYRSFPSYSEILGFYALALMWTPWILPLWQKSGILLRCIWPLLFVGLTIILTPLLQESSLNSLRALLIEDEGVYTWGQLTRAPLIFLGLLIGGFLTTSQTWINRRNISVALIGTGAILFMFFVALNYQELSITFFALAENRGKHPPDLDFILFSLSGALVIMGVAFLTNPRWFKWMTPLTLIGRDPLVAFIFHISFLFLIYRQLFNLWLQVRYLDALLLSLLLIAMTAGVIQLKLWRKKYEAPQVPSGRRPYPRGLKPRELSSH